MGTLSYLSAIFTKGDNFSYFSFPLLAGETLLEGVYSGRKEFASRGTNSFLLELITIQKGGKIKMEELLTLKMYPFTLKSASS